MNTMNGLAGVWLVAIGLVGCAAAPTGPEFGQMTLPTPTQNNPVIVVFRNHAEPTALAAKIDIDGTQVFELPQKSFAFTSGNPGKHALKLRWPAASGTPGWEGEGNWDVGKTYYYELLGSSGMGWYFKSSLNELEESLAIAKLKSCCRLITALNDSVPKAAAQTLAQRRLSPEAQTTFFKNIVSGMLPPDVVKAIGAPDHVSSQSTGKKGVPFYFGSDTRRESWSYTNIGYVVFSRNEYTATLKVVETKYDANAP